MATLSQTKPNEDASRLLQVRITELAYRRIKVHCAMTDRTPGDVVSGLAQHHLPATPDESAPEKAA